MDEDRRFRRDDLPAVKFFVKLPFWRWFMDRMHRQLGDTTPGTPVSGMRSIRGLLAAYWKSEKWLEAWLLTLSVAAMTTLLSKSSVWVAEAAADFMNAIATFHDANNLAPMGYLRTSALLLIAIAVGRMVGIGLRHLCSTTLHRKARGWMVGQYNAAILNDKATHLHLMHNKDADANDLSRMPDNPDQRIDVASQSMYGGAIGLAMGIWGAVTSIYFIGEALLQNSTPVRGLAFLGTYGSMTLAFTAVALYVPISTFIAYRIGKLIEKLTVEKQKNDGYYRGELNNMFRRVGQIAASAGETIQQRINRRLYDDVDHTWHKLNKANVSFMLFQSVYTFLGQQVVSYLPALPGYIIGNMGLKTYLAISGMTSGLINDISWFINVMPAIANLKADSQRLIELAEAIEKVQDRSKFYGETGISAFHYSTQDRRFGLRLRHVELMHQGHDAEPFLQVENLHLRRGQWTYIRGENGCGKSSLMKAIMGQWPYGRGDIIFPDHTWVFFAGQEADISDQLTLKELVAYPDAAEDYADLEVAAALSEAGLGQFIPHLLDAFYQGKRWKDVLSGGQKQKLVLARIVLQKPEVLFLDEATSAMDPAAAIAFHQAIKKHCPNAILTSIMHETTPPMAPDGRPFYTAVLDIADGQAQLHPLRQTPAGLIRPSPGVARRKGAVSAKGTHVD